jgi:hypothetical protein
MQKQNIIKERKALSSIVLGKQLKLGQGYKLQTKLKR